MILLCEASLVSVKQIEEIVQMSGVRPQSAVGAPEKASDFDVNIPPIKTSSGVRASPRPATAGLATSRSSVTSITPRPSDQTVENERHRDAVSYFDAFKKEELRELIGQSTASWLLSPDFRGKAGLPCGLISNLAISQQPHMTLLFPKEPDVPDLEYRELHQIVRELTSGIFGVSQMPHLCFETNFDLSSACQLPLAYKDTKVGQVLIAADYAMKSLWHGACVARSKRSKLTERWRTMLNVNPATGEFDGKVKNVASEFKTAGEESLSSDPIYKGVYQELSDVDPSEFAAKKENKFFNSYSDFVRCVMSFNVSKVQSSSSANVIAFDALYDISAAVTLPDNDFIAPVDLQRLRRRLRHQMKLIRKGLLLDPDARRNITLLKFISATSLILVALRRRLMKSPDVDAFLSVLSSESLRTETEMPPFAIGKPGDHSCETFSVNEKGERKLLTHAHGEIQFDVDTDDIQAFSDDSWCRTIQSNAAKHLEAILQDRPRRHEYHVPTAELDGKEQYVVHVPLTTYYPASPPLPAWLHSRYQMLSSLRPRKLPMTDLQLAEMFKQIFGFRIALANKSIDSSLKLCACRGLVAPFIALMRKTASSTLFAPDLKGMTLLHYACIHNQPSILSVLLSQNPILSNRRTEIRPKSTRATALHFASRCGSLSCVSALLASRANPVLSDALGRSAIHQAAAADQLPIARAILRRHPGLLEAPATGGDHSTPLLVAASSGALLTLKFLIKKGANIRAVDMTNDGAVQKAALNFHADVIEYFVEKTGENSKEKDKETFKVWTVLVDMLKSPFVARQDASLRCLEVLLHRVPAHWRPLQEAGAVVPLVNLLRSNKRRPKTASIHTEPGDTTYPPVRSLACSVVCLMSEQDSVRKEVADAGAIPTLIALLKPVRAPPTFKEKRSSDETLDERIELQARCSVVLSDLAHVNATSIADLGGIRPLVDLLQLEVVDVLVNVVTTLAALCRGDTSGGGDIQDRVMECGAAAFLVDFLGVRDHALQTATADAIAAVCDQNTENQNKFVKLGVLNPLVAILRGHCICAQTKAALAVDAITKNNPYAQHEAAVENAPDALCRLFQIWSDDVRERGASALWALAGEHPEQRRAIAHRIGTKQIIDLMLSKSDVLQWIGCQAVTAISRNRMSGQTRLTEDGAIPPLVRLLRLGKTSRWVTIATMDAMKSMCVGVAHLNNKKSQSQIAEEGAIELLMDRVWQTARDESMQVDVLLCLAYVVTGCQANEDKLNDLGSFGFEILLELLNSADLSVKFRASLALTLFAFNRLPQQQKMLKLGGIPCSVFDTLLESNDEIIQAGAAFQLVVLARVVSSTTVVDASARGIIVLVHLLDSNEDDVIIAAEKYLASLAHTRAGVPDAIVTSGAVPKLLLDLRSRNDQMRVAAAQALGYLSFNRNASRELMATCRAAEGVYESLVDNMDEDGKISEEFVAEFRRQSTIGLPIPKAPAARQSRPGTAVPKRNIALQNKPRKTLRARSISPGMRL